MEFLGNILPWIQVVLSVILVAVILLQQNSAGAGSAFGGDGGVINHTRRGFDKILFKATIIIAILFTISVFLPVLI